MRVGGSQPRLGFGVMVALVVALAACGPPPPPPGPPPTPSSAAPPSRPPGALSASSTPNRPSTSSTPTRPGELFGPACAQLFPAGGPGSPAQLAGLPTGAAIAAVGSLSDLSTLLKKADLTDTLNHSPTITVFAPDDQAIGAWRQSEAPDRFAALLADQNQLSDLLKYQIVAGRYDREDLAAAGAVDTLEGARLRFADDGDTLAITDSTGTVARVRCGNIPTANGTLFVLDRVPRPKRP